MDGCKNAPWEACLEKACGEQTTWLKIPLKLWNHFFVLKAIQIIFFIYGWPGSRPVRDDVEYSSSSLLGWVKHRPKVIITISLYLWHFMSVVISNVFQCLKHQCEQVVGDQSILCITASLMQRMKSMWVLTKWWNSNIHNSTFCWGPITAWSKPIHVEVRPQPHKR